MPEKLSIVHGEIITAVLKTKYKYSNSKMLHVWSIIDEVCSDEILE